MTGTFEYAIPRKYRGPKFVGVYALYGSPLRGFLRGPSKGPGSDADSIGTSAVPEAAVHIKAGQMRAYQLPDPRVDQVWALCGQAAAELGYAPPMPTHLLHDAERP